MKFSSILTAKSLALASALVFSAAGAVHAQGYDSDKDDGMQKPGDSTQYPGTSGGSDYGTSGTDQRRRDDRTDGSSGEGYGDPYQGYSRDLDSGMYDWTGNDGTGPKLKGRY
ncbi:hypothetical protein [Nitrosovibrio sp. Nv4]|uniref:hypothetical protein n=1 Tax=Nitrosovibrio sp. Nv4 TaxID=1945880 RepID=UPI000BD22258|nr:hypothetical protein [Nitrosovibrio sp. Nv4]SOD41500.1 hypothetical protein SAMN06298226_1796 [Nitrosovibrio sp. Nv4]